MTPRRAASHHSACRLAALSSSPRRPASPLVSQVATTMHALEDKLTLFRHEQAMNRGSLRLGNYFTPQERARVLWVLSDRRWVQVLRAWKYWLKRAACPRISRLKEVGDRVSYHKREQSRYAWASWLEGMAAQAEWRRLLRLALARMVRQQTSDSWSRWRQLCAEWSREARLARLGRAWATWRRGSERRTMMLRRLLMGLARVALQREAARAWRLWEERLLQSHRRVARAVVRLAVRRRLTAWRRWQTACALRHEAGRRRQSGRARLRGRRLSCAWGRWACGAVDRTRALQALRAGFAWSASLRAVGRGWAVLAAVPAVRACRRRALDAARSRVCHLRARSGWRSWREACAESSLGRRQSLRADAAAATLRLSRRGWRPWRRYAQRRTVALHQLGATLTRLACRREVARAWAGWVQVEACRTQAAVLSASSRRKALLRCLKLAWRAWRGAAQRRSAWTRRSRRGACRVGERRRAAAWVVWVGARERLKHHSQLVQRGAARRPLQLQRRACRAWRETVATRAWRRGHLRQASLRVRTRRLWQGWYDWQRHVCSRPRLLQRLVVGLRRVGKPREMRHAWAAWVATAEAGASDHLVLSVARSRMERRHLRVGWRCWAVASSLQSWLQHQLSRFLSRQRNWRVVRAWSMWGCVVIARTVKVRLLREGFEHSARRRLVLHAWAGWARSVANQLTEGRHMRAMRIRMGQHRLKLAWRAWRGAAQRRAAWTRRSRRGACRVGERRRAAAWVVWVGARERLKHHSQLVQRGAARRPLQLQRRACRAWRETVATRAWRRGHLRQASLRVRTRRLWQGWYDWQRHVCSRPRLLQRLVVGLRRVGKPREVRHAWAAWVATAEAGASDHLLLSVARSRMERRHLRVGWRSWLNVAQGRAETTTRARRRLAHVALRQVQRQLRAWRRATGYAASRRRLVHMRANFNLRKQMKRRMQEWAHSAHDIAHEARLMRAFNKRMTFRTWKSSWDEAERSEEELRALWAMFERSASRRQVDRAWAGWVRLLVRQAADGHLLRVARGRVALCRLGGGWRSWSTGAQRRAASSQLRCHARSRVRHRRTSRAWAMWVARSDQVAELRHAAGVCALRTPQRQLRRSWEQWVRRSVDVWRIVGSTKRAKAIVDTRRLRDAMVVWHSRAASKAARHRQLRARVTEVPAPETVRLWRVWRESSAVSVSRVRQVRYGRAVAAIRTVAIAWDEWSRQSAQRTEQLRVLGVMFERSASRRQVDRAWAGWVRLLVRQAADGHLLRVARGRVALCRLGGGWRSWSTGAQRRAASSQLRCHARSRVGHRRTSRAWAMWVARSDQVAELRHAAGVCALRTPQRQLRRSWEQWVGRSVDVWRIVGSTKRAKAIVGTRRLRDAMMVWHSRAASKAARHRQLRARVAEVPARETVRVWRVWRESSAVSASRVRQVRYGRAVAAIRTVAIAWDEWSRQSAQRTEQLRVLGVMFERSASRRQVDRAWAGWVRLLVRQAADGHLLRVARGRVALCRLGGGWRSWSTGAQRRAASSQLRCHARSRVGHRRTSRAWAMWVARSDQVAELRHAAGVCALRTPQRQLRRSWEQWVGRSVDVWRIVGSTKRAKAIVGTRRLRDAMMVWHSRAASKAARHRQLRARVAEVPARETVRVWRVWRESSAVSASRVRQVRYGRAVAAIRTVAIAWDEWSRQSAQRTEQLRMLGVMFERSASRRQVDRAWAGWVRLLVRQAADGHLLRVARGRVALCRLGAGWRSWWTGAQRRAASSQLRCHARSRVGHRRTSRAWAMWVARSDQVAELRHAAGVCALRTPQRQLRRSWEQWECRSVDVWRIIGSTKRAKAIVGTRRLRDALVVWHSRAASKAARHRQLRARVAEVPARETVRVWRVWRESSAVSASRVRQVRYGRAVAAIRTVAIAWDEWSRQSAQRTEQLRVLGVMFERSASRRQVDRAWAGWVRLLVGQAADGHLLRVARGRVALCRLGGGWRSWWTGAQRRAASSQLRCHARSRVGHRRTSRAWAMWVARSDQVAELRHAAGVCALRTPQRQLRRSWEQWVGRSVDVWRIVGSTKRAKAIVHTRRLRDAMVVWHSRAASKVARHRQLRARVTEVPARETVRLWRVWRESSAVSASRLRQVRYGRAAAAIRTMEHKWGVWSRQSAQRTERLRVLGVMFERSSSRRQVDRAWAGWVRLLVREAADGHLLRVATERIILFRLHVALCSWLATHTTALVMARQKDYGLCRLFERQIVRAWTRWVFWKRLSSATGDGDRAWDMSRLLERKLRGSWAEATASGFDMGRRLHHASLGGAEKQLLRAWRVWRRSGKDRSKMLRRILSGLGRVAALREAARAWAIWVKRKATRSAARRLSRFGASRLKHHRARTAFKAFRKSCTESALWARLACRAKVLVGDRRMRCAWTFWADMADRTATKRRLSQKAHTFATVFQRARSAKTLNADLPRTSDELVPATSTFEEVNDDSQEAELERMRSAQSRVAKLQIAALRDVLAFDEAWKPSQNGASRHFSGAVRIARTPFEMVLSSHEMSGGFDMAAGAFGSDSAAGRKPADKSNATVVSALCTDLREDSRRSEEFDSLLECASIAKSHFTHSPQSMHTWISQISFKTFLSLECAFPNLSVYLTSCVLAMFRYAARTLKALEHSKNGCRNVDEHVSAQKAPLNGAQPRLSVDSRVRQARVAYAAKQRKQLGSTAMYLSSTSGPVRVATSVAQSSCHSQEELLAHTMIRVPEEQDETCTSDESADSQADDTTSERQLSSLDMSLEANSLDSVMGPLSEVEKQEIAKATRRGALSRASSVVRLQRLNLLRDQLPSDETTQH
ncbi:hypothetical protein AB1Y20_015525 [Prymnesium parvum]|uniref:Uncharacterized protein n=1 Tax=Prymnesium parvum TaxID=97485 RepID=A0AB34JXF7_PRYPA